MTWYDLTQPFHGEMPHSSGLPDPALETLQHVSCSGTNVQQYCATTHVGTHVDAPLHFVPNGPTIDEFSLDRFAGPGIVLNLEQTEPVEITLEAVKSAANDAGGVRRDDIVLIRTGWGSRFSDPDEYARYPWLASAVGEWLREQEIRLLGVDTISPDRPRSMRPADWDTYPIHRTLLPDEIFIAEHLQLESIPATRVTVIAFPLKLQGGDGAPVRIGAKIEATDPIDNEGSHS